MGQTPATVYQKLIEAKRKLYLATLKVPHQELTDSEVSIGHALCQDQDIRIMIRKALIAQATEE